LVHVAKLVQDRETKKTVIAKKTLWQNDEGRGGNASVNGTFSGKLRLSLRARAEGIRGTRGVNSRN